MSALTSSARPEDNPSQRAVPWRRMGWVTWRQHRLALAGVAVFLGALAVWVWRVGLQLHQAFAAATACRPANSFACGELLSRFNTMDGFLANGSVLQAVPALIGAFAGAPVLARELETGTFRYAWTQGFGPWRWTLAKLVPLAVVLAVAAGAFSMLLSWYYQPYFAAGNQNLSLKAASPLVPTLFDLRGVALAGWTLTAFAIGALAGMLIRRVIPAMAATMAACLGLIVAAAVYLRPHYLTPLRASTQNVSGSAYVLSQWGTRAGQVAFTGFPPRNLIQHLCPPPAVGAHVNKSLTIAQCLSQHGYTWWTSYQPASRFWPFQWIEGGWLLALSVLLISATVWLVRRRAA